MTNRFKNYLIILLAVIIAIFYAYIRIERKIAQNREDKLAVLDTSIKKVCTIANGLLVEKYRNAQGKIEVKRTYIPPESRITVTVLNTGDTTIKFKTYGLCLEPGVSISGYWNPVNLELFFSPKIAYWSRYGLILNVNHHTFGAGISRHLDDMFFIYRPQNLEVFVTNQFIRYSSTVPSQTWLGGLRVSF